MAYTSWSVISGEIPTASKWNILGTNDASFNDGTGIGTNAVAAASLATSAITLGYTQITSNFTTTSASYTALTGLSQAVTIPSGSRRVLIHVFVSEFSTSSAANPYISIWDGTVGSGTQLSQGGYYSSVGGAQTTMNVFANIASPAAGAKTYNAGAKTNGGTLTAAASATAPAFIWVGVI